MKNNRISLPEAMEARAVNEIPAAVSGNMNQNGMASVACWAVPGMPRQCGPSRVRLLPATFLKSLTPPLRFPSAIMFSMANLSYQRAGIFVRMSASADSPGEKQDKTARRRDAGLVCRIRSVEAKRERSRRHEAERPARRA